ncbi:hypothetical protein [Devosia sp. 2618]|uniref:hypothetical protein n=1 Tax=Devosia sp. 2618 TaxID=3156454 RepID=UPI003399AD22
MKRLIFAVFLATTLLSAAQAQQTPNFENLTVEQLQQQAADLHPAALYLLASRLLQRGDGQGAANWMYAGQLRYRFLLEAEGAAGRDDRVLFDALSEQVGRPIDEYIAGDVDEWLAAMDWALEWDAANDNGTTSKAEYASALAKTRAGLESFRQSVEAQREEIPQQRAANGLENR